MTELLFQVDSYIREFDAAVVDVRPDGVVLDRTAFYPGGGGQPHDTGALRAGERALPVARVSGRGGVIVHGVPEGSLAAGDRVRGAIDWSRRHRLMRTHTALHIMCGVIWRDFGALVTGGNMAPLRARMDFELDRMSAGFAARVEELANAEVAADRAVSVRVLPRAEAFAIPDLIRTKVNLLPPGIQQVRVVEIVGLDMQADGGTHVASTGEVGRIRVVGHQSKGRSNKRLRIALDE